MEYLRFIFYGIIQGLTEFIPVSSTAHLKIISLLFGINDPGSSVSAIIQIGSVFAIIWYFRKSIFNFKSTNSRKQKNPFLVARRTATGLCSTFSWLCQGSSIRCHMFRSVHLVYQVLQDYPGVEAFSR